jgi:hypothetical protein
MPADLTSCIPLHTLAVHLHIASSAEFPPHSKHNVSITNTTGIMLRVLCTVCCESAHCAHRYVSLCTSCLHLSCLHCDFLNIFYLTQIFSAEIFKKRSGGPWPWAWPVYTKSMKCDCSLLCSSSVCVSAQQATNSLSKLTAHTSARPPLSDGAMHGAQTPWQPAFGRRRLT